MNNFPFNPSNSQNYPTFNSFQEYQAYMQWLQNNPPPYSVNLSNDTPNTQQSSIPNFCYSQIPNTQQYDAPTPNQGSSNRDWVTGEDDEEDVEEADVAEPILTPAVLCNPSEQNRVSIKGGKRSWSHREEEALIASYMLHCTDQTMSTNRN